jgi:DNA polymerase II large subunit
MAEPERSEPIKAPEAKVDTTTRSATTEMMEGYFKTLEDAARVCYSIAGDAREMGLDPSSEVEMPLTYDLAARVESLVGPVGIAETIRVLAKTMDRERLAIEITLKVIDQGKFKNDEEAIYQAIRTGLAVLTEGVLVAPLEGVTGVKIMSNADSTVYPAVFFAGPIRSAGGTGQAMSVLLADVVRRKLGLGRYRPTLQEIERYKEEMPIYRQCQHLQYTPSAQEVETVVRNCPVCIDGDGTDDEVSGNRDLPRVPTNKTRGGACLVIAEGMIQKAQKILKHVDKLGLDGWSFLESFRKDKVKKEEPKPAAPAAPAFSPAKTEAVVAQPSQTPLTASADASTDDEDDKRPEDEDEEEEEEGEEGEDGEEDKSDESDEEGEEPKGPGGSKFLYDYTGTCSKTVASNKYMKDIIAGRPVFSHPSRPGGFRLRYGKTRTTGLAAAAIHPAAMVLLDNFLAVGTQVKIERPGKAGAITPCDSIEGPIVLLQSGDLIQINEVEWAEKLKDQVKEIIDVGEILSAFGEFLENNHNLVPGAFSIEWWRLLAAKAFEDGANINPAAVPGPEDAFKISEEYGLPLHPDYNLFWHDLTPDQIHQLALFVREKGRYEDGTLILPKDQAIKDLLVILGALHIEIEDNLIFDQYALALVRAAGLDQKMAPRRFKKGRVPKGSKGSIPKPEPGVDPMAYVSELSGVRIMSRAPTRIGARMARPEKAKERRMKPPPHVLFPVGQAGGNQRLVKEAGQDGILEVEANPRICLRCKKLKINISEMLEAAKIHLGESNIPPIKGVQGMISKIKTPEALEKGILRAKHGIWVFKDGTIRFDLTDVPLSHFKCKEIGLPVEKAIALGYTLDIEGKPLTKDDQVLELRVQDVIVNTRCGRYFLGVTKFIDDLLVKFYKLKPFYNAVSPEDLIGHLVVGLAPHTSAGILGRIIGYTPSQVCLAHPYWHAAKRRNCDGDEDSVMLLMDCLLNFSKHYLPERRGGLMDAPLVLSARLNPSEIDKEAQNLDVGKVYPLALYDAALKGSSPKEVEKLMDLVSARIGKPSQYEGFHYTHNTSDINLGPKASSYKTLVSMMDKLEAQFELGRKIRAVDVADVATKVIESHFLPDLIGNLKRFSKQTFRCTKCGRKYRRMPLKGACYKCGGNLTLTVYEKSVKKYLEVTKKMAEKYHVSNYTKQRVLLVEQAIDSLFENDRVKKSKLEDFGLNSFM